jgi:hypothetical protein
LHIWVAQLSFSLFEQRKANNDLGDSVPAVVGGRITYEPAPLQALATGIRAYLDVQECLAMPGVRAAIGEGRANGFKNEAEFCIVQGMFARAAYAGSIQEAAVGRILTADRDDMVACLRARNKEVPRRLLGRLGITEGPLADAMAERTRVLYEGAKTAGLDNQQYAFAWSRWAAKQRPSGF